MLLGETKLPFSVVVFVDVLIFFHLAVLVFYLLHLFGVFDFLGTRKLDRDE